MINRFSSWHFAPQTHMHDDAVLVHRAVEASCVSDFDFFRAAWHAWYGTQPNEKLLERIFVDYLFYQQVPGFTRHFANRVLQTAVTEPLNPTALGLDGLKRVPRP